VLRTGRRASASVLPPLQALPPRVGHAGPNLGEREACLARLFWEKWGDFLRARTCAVPEGKLRSRTSPRERYRRRHRDIFEHLNRDADRGPRCLSRFVPARRAPTVLSCECRGTRSITYDELVRRRAWKAIKARCGNGGAVVGNAQACCAGHPGVLRAGPRESYYPDDERTRHAGDRLLSPGVPPTDRSS